MATAVFKHGNPVMVDYTPEADVAAGDIVLFNTVPVIAHKDIAANTLGAVAISGGVYEIEKDANAIVRGAAVYYDDDSDKAVREQTSNYLLGIATAEAGSSASTVLVYHQPEGAESSSE